MQTVTQSYGIYYSLVLRPSGGGGGWKKGLKHTQSACACAIILICTTLIDDTLASDTKQWPIQHEGFLYQATGDLHQGIALVNGRARQGSLELIRRLPSSIICFSVLITCYCQDLACGRPCILYSFPCMDSTHPLTFISHSIMTHALMLII